MFVTRITLRGITQVVGTFSIHAALLLTLLLYYPTSESTVTETQLPGGNTSNSSLYRLMIVTHASLFCSATFVN